MSFFELIFFAVALSMDAFAVAICIGLSRPKFKLIHGVIVGLYFGVFQAVMPVIGYWAGSIFAERITTFDHWIAFGVLAFLGVRMVVGAIKGEETSEVASIGIAAMFPLAVATSIDAMAAGVSFAFMRVSIAPVVIFIGVVTFLFSAIGVKVGSIAGVRFKTRAEIAGGIILVLLGFSNLIQGLL